MPVFSDFSFDFGCLRDPRERLRKVLLELPSLREMAPSLFGFSELAPDTLVDGSQNVQTEVDDEGLVEQWHADESNASAIVEHGYVKIFLLNLKPITQQQPFS